MFNFVHIVKLYFNHVNKIYRLYVYIKYVYVYRFEPFF